MQRLLEQGDGSPTALPLGYPVDVLAKVMKNHDPSHGYTALQQLLQELAEQHPQKYAGIAAYPSDAWAAVEEAKALMQGEHPV